MAYTRQDSFLSVSTFRQNIFTSERECQTFTPTVSYDLTKVVLRIARIAGPVGNAVMSIRATDGLGKPTEVALATVSVDCSLLGTEVGGAWIDFVLSAPLALTSGITYAITFYPDDEAANLIWALSSSDNLYAGGQRGRSTDYGVTWELDIYITNDFAFQIYSDDGFTVQDFYIVESYSSVSVGSFTWYGQNFTASASYTATRIDLLVYRVGTPGNVIVNLYATDGSGFPTTLLDSAIIDGDSLTTHTDGEWYTLYFDHALVSGIKYAIIPEPSASGFWIRRHVVSPSYSGGNVLYTGDSGSSWSDLVGQDLMFAVYSGALLSVVITEQPDNLTANVGDTANFSITATGDPAPTYQWYKDGSPLSGEISDSLSFTVDADSGGDYTCVATNDGGSVTSDTAILSIIPLITAQSGATGILLGASASLSITAVGTPTPTYQWYKNGSPISGETSTTLSLNFVVASDAATYTCIVTNGVGSDTSSSIVVVIMDNPYIWNLFNLTLDAGRAD